MHLSDPIGWSRVGAASKNSPYLSSCAHRVAATPDPRANRQGDKSRTRSTHVTVQTKSTIDVWIAIALFLIRAIGVCLSDWLARATLQFLGRRCGCIASRWRSGCEHERAHFLVSRRCGRLTQPPHRSPRALQCAALYARLPIGQTMAVSRVDSIDELLVENCRRRSIEESAGRDDAMRKRLRRYDPVSVVRSPQ